MFKKMNNSTSTEVKYNAVSSIKNIAPEGTLQRLLFLNGGGPSKHKGTGLSKKRFLSKKTIIHVFYRKKVFFCILCFFSATHRT